MYINAIAGMLYLGVATILGSLAFVDVWPWNFVLGSVAVVNLVAGWRLLERAYAVAYRGDDED